MSERGERERESERKQRERGRAERLKWRDKNKATMTGATVRRVRGADLRSVINSPGSAQQHSGALGTSPTPWSSLCGALYCPDQGIPEMSYLRSGYIYCGPFLSKT